VRVHLADGEAVLDAQNIPLFDWGTIPNSLANGAHAAATVSLRIVWYGRGTQVPFSSAAAKFKGAYSVNSVVVRAIARTPSQSLKLVTDPLSTVTNFAQIGTEANGFFFTHECEDEDEDGKSD
jgi:hypothetical protein